MNRINLIVSAKSLFSFHLFAFFARLLMKFDESEFLFFGPVNFENELSEKLCEKFKNKEFVRDFFTVNLIVLRCFRFLIEHFYVFLDKKEFEEFKKFNWKLIRISGEEWHWVDQFSMENLPRICLWFIIGRKKRSISILANIFACEKWKRKRDYERLNFSWNWHEFHLEND